MELVSIFFLLFYTLQIRPTGNNHVHFVKKNISSVIESAIFSEIFQDDDLDAKVCFCDP